MTNEEPAKCAVAQLKIAQLERETNELWREIQGIRTSHTKLLLWVITLLMSALGAMLANELV